MPAVKSCPPTHGVGDDDGACIGIEPVLESLEAHCEFCHRDGVIGRKGIRAIWEALYGIDGESVRPDRAAIPGTTSPKNLPNFMKDGSIMPPAVDR